MTNSKTWAKPELSELPVDRTLGGTVPGFTEDDEFIGESGIVRGIEESPGS